jgi:hypothetical protein
MTQWKVHISCAPEDLQRIPPLKAALSSDQIATGEAWDECDLFLACCSANGIFPKEEVLLARQHLRLHPRAGPWLVAIQLDACKIPEPLLGVPVVSFEGDWQAATARIAVLLGAEPRALSRFEINAENIMAPEIMFENPPANLSKEMKIGAHDITGDKKVTFKNG